MAPTLSAAQVRASLVALESAARPGQPLQVALKLEHDVHWHTYWVQAGTGYPTSIQWQLPPGWSAGEIEWPTPQVIRDAKGNITGNGYEGVTFLPLQLRAPADLSPGTTVTLRGTAEWLMCDPHSCVPGDAAVSLTLPVSTEAQSTAETAGFDPASLPQIPEGWTFRAARDGKTVLVDVRPPAGHPALALTGPTQPWFFASDAYIQYDEPQRVSATPDGGVRLQLTVSPSAEGTPDRLRGVLTYAASGGQLRGLSLDVPFTSGGGDGTAAASATGVSQGGTPLSATLALAFLGGLILNLMPCVFPVLGIKVLGFVNQAGSERRKVTQHGLAFTAGVLLSFWLLAGILAMLRAGGDQLGWGFQLQSPAFVFALAAGLLVFALSMSGVFEFGLSATSVGSGLQTKQGVTGSFFTGVLATVVATPCSAPFLAPALGAALTLSLTQSFAVFTAIGLGLSVPYLALSLFPQAVRLLPRPGAWMETFKQAMAFPLYATVAFLVWVLAGQMNEGAFLNALLGLTLLAFGIWLYGRSVRPDRKRTSRFPLGLTLGLGCAALGLFAGWPRTAAPNEVVWEPWSAERVAALRAEGRPIYIDFTARWCATCQSNKKFVFSSGEVLDEFRRRKVATLKADWTNRDPSITAELQKWNRSAVPFNLVYLPGQDKATALPELLTPDIVLAAIRGENPT